LRLGFEASSCASARTPEPDTPQKVPEPTKSTKAEKTTDAAWKTKGRRSLVVRIIVHFPFPFRHESLTQ